MERFVDSSSSIGQWLEKSISPNLRVFLTLLGLVLLLIVWVLTWFNILNGLRSTLLTIGIIVIVPILMIAVNNDTNLIASRS